MVERPVICTENIPYPNWIAGFVVGASAFGFASPTKKMVVLMLELHNQQLKLDSEYN